MTEALDLVPDKLLSTAEVARVLGIAPGSWRVYVSRGIAPPADDPGDLQAHPTRRNPRWRGDTVSGWLASRPGAGARTDMKESQ